MSSLGPRRFAALDALAGDPVEAQSPAASVAATLEWKPAAVTHPSPTPATTPSTGSASFLAFELRPKRQSAGDFMGASGTSFDQSNRCWTRSRPLVQDLECSEARALTGINQVGRPFRGPSVGC
jgi:hypothetical protein